MSVDIVAGTLDDNFTVTLFFFPWETNIFPVLFNQQPLHMCLNTFDLGDLHVGEDEDTCVTGGYCGFSKQSGVSKETA